MSDTIPDLARALFDAYNASTGGLTWDGKPVPPYDVIAQNTPHVARAWEAAARKAVEMIGRPEMGLSPVAPVSQTAPACDAFTAPPGNPGARVIRTG